MTEDERREAELLAQEKFPDVPGMNHLGTREVWKAGYAAACEAKRRERDAELDAADGLAEIRLRQLEAERARSAKLIEALKWYASPFSYITGNIGSIADLQARAIDALREMEASRD